jgi:predicted small secreted protein
MFERLRRKNIIPKLVLIASGSLAVAGCSVTVEGVGDVPMVNCGTHGTPRTNNDKIKDLPKGATVQLGQDISYGGNDQLETGDFQVKSDGKGRFNVSIESGNNSNGDAEIIPNYSDSPNTVTVSDNGELFVISGSTGPQGSTALSVNVSCNKA